MSTANKTDALSPRKHEQELRDELRGAKQQASSPVPRLIKQYHVFLASPGDVNGERQHVRKFFERYNGHTAQLWNVRFEVVDWENYATIGVGRPQELITRRTLQKFQSSLALVIGIMNQRFGSQPADRLDLGRLRSVPSSET